MVNPTGYTALDLVGYTDRGDYSPSANYVKNDLVHYSGNIWRVLIDDTTNVTPSEGANYTLFIGEPSNLVEAAIAPMENSPTTAAYTVGRRLFFNDILYEVIAPIAIGDTLVTYESDPTNANIKVSAKVEEQIDDINASIQTLDNAKADKALVITLPNVSSNKLSFTSSDVAAIANITANHVLTGYCVFSNPSAQGSDWTVTTAANSIVIQGTVSGTTNLTLGFIEQA